MTLTAATTETTTTTESTTTDKALALPQEKIRLRNTATYQIPIHRNGLTYLSNNPSAVTVSENGVVNVVGEGNALVFITDEENHFTSLTITAMPVDCVPYVTGDVNGDDKVNASDATSLLMFSAMMGAGKNARLTDEQAIACNVNGDDGVNAADASVILMYAAALGAGKRDAKIEDFT